MSAHVDRFVQDRLPPQAQWPEFRYDTPELKLPSTLNLVESIVDSPVQLPLEKTWAVSTLVRVAGGSISGCAPRLPETETRLSEPVEISPPPTWWPFMFSCTNAWQEPPLPVAGLPDP